MESILVIEDDEALGMGIEYALKKESFGVSVAKTIHNGYELYKSGAFQLILLDVMLPDGSGYDLCKRIRKESAIPILFLTACDEEVNVVLGLDIGGDDYITKPFRVRELISRIKVALRRNSSEKVSDKSILGSGDIVIHLLQTKAFKDSRELSLTPVEFKLLTMFIQNPMQTLTRDQILEKLWDIEGEFVDDNTLSVYIRRLREKIEADPSSPDYIVTVRGMGYRWNRPNGV
ncbi:MAG: response regulator transcription factor [Clostridia bacterium]|nr:response regulator transcription factor [Clostridia bacterium]